jgi:hypothetical protein
MMRALLAIVIMFIQVPALWADVLVFDAVAVTGRPVMLKARTVGIIMAEGGKLVDFSVEGKALGRRLSGGDGMAYIEYTPRRAGLLKVKAKSGGEEATGLLLVLGKKDRVVLIDVAGALATGGLFPAPRSGGAEAMDKLGEHYRLIYYSSGPLGTIGYRAWLKENGFPKHLVLDWKGERTVENLLDLGVTVRAAVGGAEFVRAAARSKDTLLFSFDPDSEGTRVRSWDDILKELLP